MLDDDDLDFAILMNMGARGWSAVIGLIIIIVIFIAVALNHEECASKHCEHGAPVLMHHECLCVEKPTGAVP